MRDKIWVFLCAGICLSLLVVTWNFFLQCETSKAIHERFNEVKWDSQDTVTRFTNLSNIDIAKKNSQIEKPQEIVIAAVVCENRLNEILVLIKSALITTNQTFIRFLIFADTNASSSLNETVKQWPSNVTNRMSLELHPLYFPAENYEEWKKSFKPCACQRLFLPNLLQNVDSVLYVDTDTIFLSSPLKIWEHFNRMNETQIAAAAPEHEDFPIGWYNRFAKIPYYGDLGLNSGMMLMNLTRMRQFDWVEYAILIQREYKGKLELGDQDIINIVFHFHPKKLYVSPCNCNYRSDHCMHINKYPKSACKTAEEQGIFLIHGNRGIFHDKKEPSFKAIFSTIEQYSFGEDLQTLTTKLNKSLTETLNTDCGKLISNYLAKHNFWLYTA